MVRELIKMSFVVVSIFVFNAIATNTITLPTDALKKQKVKRVAKKPVKAPKITLVDYKKSILEMYKDQIQN